MDTREAAAAFRTRAGALHERGGPHQHASDQACAVVAAFVERGDDAYPALDHVPAASAAEVGQLVAVWALDAFEQRNPFPEYLRGLYDHLSRYARPDSGPLYQSFAVEERGYGASSLVLRILDAPARVVVDAADAIEAMRRCYAFAANQVPHIADARDGTPSDETVGSNAASRTLAGASVEAQYVVNRDKNLARLGALYRMIDRDSRAMLHEVIGGASEDAIRILAPAEALLGGQDALRLRPLLGDDRDAILDAVQALQRWIAKYELNPDYESQQLTATLLLNHYSALAVDIDALDHGQAMLGHAVLPPFTDPVIAAFLTIEEPKSAGSRHARESWLWGSILAADALAGLAASSVPALSDALRFAARRVESRGYAATTSKRPWLIV